MASSGCLPPKSDLKALDSGRFSLIDHGPYSFLRFALPPKKVRSGTLVGTADAAGRVLALNDVMGKWLVATYSVGPVRSCAASRPWRGSRPSCASESALRHPAGSRACMLSGSHCRPSRSRLLLGRHLSAACGRDDLLPRRADLRGGLCGLLARREDRQASHHRHRARLRRRSHRASPVAGHPVAAGPHRPRRKPFLLAPDPSPPASCGNGRRDARVATTAPDLRHHCRNRPPPGSAWPGRSIGRSLGPRHRVHGSPCLRQPLAEDRAGLRGRALSIHADRLGHRAGLSGVR